MKQISQAVVDGDKLCSSNLYFYPKNIISGSYKCESHTAASVTLMTQSLIPTLIYGSKNSTVSLKVNNCELYIKIYKIFEKGRHFSLEFSTQFFYFQYFSAAEQKNGCVI